MYVSAWQGLSPSMLLGQRFRAATAVSDLPYPFSAHTQIGFHVARNAIYHLIKALDLRGDDTVLMPSYHSGNEVQAVQAAGAHVEFFSIDRCMQVDLNELEQRCNEKPRMLFVIHYLGWSQPMTEIRELCDRHGIILVEDCALSLLSEDDGRSLGSLSDYAVFCLYKTLPIPAGGLLVQNGHSPLAGLEAIELEAVSGLSTAGQVTQLWLEWVRLRSDLVGRSILGLKRIVGRTLSAMRVERVPVGDMGFDADNVNLGMSRFAQKMIPTFDYPGIKTTRRQNFQQLDAMLDGVATTLDLRLESGACPLFYPIVVEDKQRAWSQLKARGIEATLFWNEGVEARGAFPDTDFLRDHVLELPIHQDLTEKHMAYMAREIGKLKLSFDATARS